MPIPDYKTAMLPLLQLASDGKEHSVRDAIERLSETFSLTDEEMNALLPSGTAPVMASRVGWARTYLKQAGLLVAPRRGVFKITERGQALLSKNLAKIDLDTLEHYQEFREFRARRRDVKDEQTSEAGIAASMEPHETDQTPEDQLASAYERLRTELELELLDQVKNATPAFFERMVVDLLVAMGYGGSRQDAGRAVGKSGDGGIDGIIKEDRLGLDAIYMQAKLWQATIGRPEIQKFAGALQGQRATKGVFITTSN